MGFSIRAQISQIPDSLLDAKTAAATGCAIGEIPQARQGVIEESKVSRPQAARRLGRLGAVKYNRTFLEGRTTFQQ
jgi:hypothetical protein